MGFPLYCSPATLSIAHERPLLASIIPRRLVVTPRPERRLRRFPERDLASVTSQLVTGIIDTAKIIIDAFRLKELALFAAVHFV
jgi:hypothetical protein